MASTYVSVLCKVKLLKLHTNLVLYLFLNLFYYET